MTRSRGVEWHDSLGKLLLRMLVGGLMLFHGADKLLHGVAGVAMDVGRAGLPPLLAYGVFVGEIVAPLLLIIGVYTRTAALVYAFTVLFATLLVHARDYVRLAPTGGWAAELHVFYVVGACVVALLGPGAYALRRATTLRLTPEE